MMKIARLGVALLLAVCLLACELGIGDIFDCRAPDCLPAGVDGAVALRAEEAIPCCGEPRTFDVESAYDNAVLLAGLRWRDENVELQLTSATRGACEVGLRVPPSTSRSKSICLWADQGEAVQVIVQGDANAEAQPYTLIVTYRSHGGCGQEIRCFP